MFLHAPAAMKPSVVLANTPTSTPRNWLLAALPPEDLAWLWPRLEPVELPMRHTLHRPGDTLGAIHFPEAGCVSLLACLEDGEGSEVAAVGREGMLGLPLLLGSGRTEFEAMVRAPGTALRLAQGALRESLECLPAFRMLLLRYAWVRHVHSTRMAVCNSRHRIEQRLARALLMAQDRADDEAFPMTHEFLSMSLGVRRAGITVAAGGFQRLGLIRYSAGRIAITDRAGLEDRTCECYGMIRQAFRHLCDPID